MNLKTFVKLTNIVAVVSILLLIYWVFIFVSTEVFGFKIFRENISQTFAMSVLGILALMGGSLMINVMFNLTRIAQKHNGDALAEAKGLSKHLVLAFVLSFPVIFGFLFFGDYMTSKKKQDMLLRSARSIVQANTAKAGKMTNYSFTSEWLTESSETLVFFEKTEKNFPNAVVIVRDSVEGTNTFLAIDSYRDVHDENGALIPPVRKTFLMKTTEEEREYLNRIFDQGSSETRFSASDGNYELYYPFTEDGKTIILYFSDSQRYGKMGS